MTERPDHCPTCGVSLQGDPIPHEYRVHKDDCAEQVARHGRCYCRPYGSATHFRREIGHEVPGVYDGVLFWHCPECGWAWPRFVATSTTLGQKSAEHADRWNRYMASGSSEGKAT